MFPAGLPGLALLALRASVVLALLADLVANLQGTPRWLQAAGVILSSVLALGWLTPIAALVALMAHLSSWFLLGVPGVAATGVVVLDLVALSLLGPGAYSVDSYRYGRRVLVVPPR